MRNKDNRAFKGFQETFQPVDGFDIEVVSGLIQQQHARPTDQARPSAALRSQPPDSDASCALASRPSCSITSLMRLSSCHSPEVIELLLQARQFI